MNAKPNSAHVSNQMISVSKFSILVSKTGFFDPEKIHIRIGNYVKDMKKNRKIFEKIAHLTQNSPVRRPVQMRPAIIAHPA